jgi:excisionase family DNA binding protein
MQRKPKRERKPPEYMRLSELAQRLDCEHTHLCNLAERGVIPAIRIGSLYRVRLEDAERIFREGAPLK